MLAWLSPFWQEDLTITVPAGPAQCARRLESFAGRPGPFGVAATTGRVSPAGFRLDLRSSSRGWRYPTAIVEGRFVVTTDGTQVEIHTSHAPEWLVVALLVFVSACWVAALPTGPSPWRIGLPAVVVVGWIGGSWMHHRQGRTLRRMILAALTEERPQEE